MRAEHMKMPQMFIDYAEEYRAAMKGCETPAEAVVALKAAGLIPEEPDSLVVCPECGHEFEACGCFGA